MEHPKARIEFHRTGTYVPLGVSVLEAVLGPGFLDLNFLRLEN